MFIITYKYSFFRSLTPPRFRPPLPSSTATKNSTAATAVNGGETAGYKVPPASPASVKLDKSNLNLGICSALLDLNYYS